MIISCRHRALLKRLAESPNAYPWSVDTQSKLEGSTAERTQDENPPQTIVKLKVNRKINKKEKDVPMTLNQLQSIQTVNDLANESKDKEKQKNAKRKRED